MSVPLLVCLLAGASGFHEEANPLYQQLRSQGVVVQGKTLATLPPPTVPDGLDAAAQKAALLTIPMRLPLDEFTRDSIVAPYSISIGDLMETPAGIRIRTLDIWFMVYGDLKTIRTNRQWLDDFLRHLEKDAHVLSADELQQRNISIPAELAERTSYTHAASTLLERVYLEVTTHAVFSHGQESTLLAAVVDPRFLGDPQFPNRWRPVEISEGRTELGPAEPYSVSAGYWKATQLRTPDALPRPPASRAAVTTQAPAGAILVEYHSVFEQPPGWFGGRDLLRSKLPLAVQSEVRTFRRKVKKALSRN